MVLADSEHYTTELLDHVHLETPFELLVPIPPQDSPKLQNQALSSERFNLRWAGYATAKEAFSPQTEPLARALFPFRSSSFLSVLCILFTEMLDRCPEST